MEGRCNSVSRELSWVLLSNIPNFKVLTLPSPICSWNWLQHPPHAPKQDIAVISWKTLLHFWTTYSPHPAKGTQIPDESKYEISHCTQQFVVLPPLLWPDLTANMKHYWLSAGS